MTFPLFLAPEREPSRFVGFAGNTIDRQSENRSDDSLEAALADARTRIMITRGGRLHLKLDGGAFDPYFARAEAQAMQVEAQTRAALTAQIAMGAMTSAEANQHLQQEQQQP